MLSRSSPVLGCCDQGGLRAAWRRGCVHTGDTSTGAGETHWIHHTPGTFLGFLCVVGNIIPITDGETDVLSHFPRVTPLTRVTATTGTWPSSSDFGRDPLLCCSPVQLKRPPSTHPRCPQILASTFPSSKRFVSQTTPSELEHLFHNTCLGTKAPKRAGDQ